MCIPINVAIRFCPSQLSPPDVQASSITRSSVKTSGMRSIIRDLETREKGVDICIMMDGTGSMVSKVMACTLKVTQEWTYQGIGLSQHVINLMRHSVLATLRCKSL